MKIEKLEDCTNGAAARDFGSKSKCTQRYNFVKDLDYGELTNAEVWHVVTHQPQGPVSGAGRLRNMATLLFEYIHEDSLTKKVTRALQPALKNLDRDGDMWTPCCIL